MQQVVLPPLGELVQLSTGLSSATFIHRKGTLKDTQTHIALSYTELFSSWPRIEDGSCCSTTGAGASWACCPVEGQIQLRHRTGQHSGANGHRTVSSCTRAREAGSKRDAIPQPVLWLSFSVQDPTNKLEGVTQQGLGFQAPALLGPLRQPSQQSAAELHAGVGVCQVR